MDINLTKKDVRILAELEKNSRQSYSRIGRIVGLSSSNVRKRISKLFDLGVINSLFAEPNLSKLGLKTYRLYLRMRSMGVRVESRFRNYIRNHPQIQWYAELEGSWHYILRYSVRDEFEFKKSTDEVLGLFGLYVESKAIGITTRQTYLPLTYLTQNNGPIMSVFFQKHANDTLEPIDKINEQILAELFNNSRITTVELGNKLGVSADTITYRIRNLRKRGIISYFGAYYNTYMLGYNRYKILLWLDKTNKKEIEKLMHYIEYHPNTTYLNEVIGEWDLEFDIDTKSQYELHNIIGDLDNRFTKTIKRHSVLMIVKEYLPNFFGKR